MIEKILFTTIFIISLSGIQIASFEDWLILSFVIQALWVCNLSNKTLKQYKSKRKKETIILTFNKTLIPILILDIITIVFSTSFAFRILFAHLYKSIIVISVLGISISLIVNYHIIINKIIENSSSTIKKIIEITSALLYPIGVYVIKIGHKKGVRNDV
ncbi:hypothetical protein FUAX_32830 [Fulvitalea axinellae]|uniref:Group-specific protein n=1 Tax=Fulvitalea axinellae TaxID=1182444 RepID=A0AAU9CFC2_9BACT|nr:hypothetical protein FUAX_32830 [Fulvitalea axinellae]